MKGRTILIVDDENGIRKSIERTLHNEPYRKLYASCVEEAKKLLNENKVHLIISDILMPGTDGITLLKWVKKNYPETVRIVLSTKSDSATILEAINKGNIFYYIPKPWDNTELKIIITKGIEWYNLQEERNELIKELEEHNMTLEQRINERSSQLLAISNEAEIGKHTSQIVHNINNALNGILGSLDLSEVVLSEKDPDIRKLKQYHQYLKKSACSLSKILAEILVRSRRKDNLQPQEININSLIEEETLFWEMMPEFKYKITRNIQLNESIPCILGNPIQIKQILDNVIKNAIDAMEKSIKKHLTIETDIKDKFIFLKISDSGEGISKGDLSRIFTPGFTTKPLGKGTGLGLASVKTMVESYSGKIDIQSEKNKGTTVTIFLPVKAENESPAGSYNTGGMNEAF